MNDDHLTAMESTLSTRPRSRLEYLLKSGVFAVTSEFDSPDSADPKAVYRNAQILAKSCDAINVTDSSGAYVHISSVAACALLIRNGLDVVFQMSCRDRNRIAIQGELLGAAALGIRNVLCLTGDGVQTGDHPDAKPVFDLDSITLLQTAKLLRDKGTLLGGRKLSQPPSYFIGAVENPFAPPFDFRPLRLGKKIAAGAEFIQTQLCFDVPRLRSFLSSASSHPLFERAAILVGVGPIRSAKSAEWMRTRVPGICIPDAIVNRMKGISTERQQAEGKKICVELIEEIRTIPGVKGIHLMAYKQQEIVSEILEEVGLLPRPAEIHFNTDSKMESNLCLP